MLTKIIVLTLAIEFFTIIARILFGSMKEKYKKIKFQYKLRIHHGYLGIILVLIHLFYPIELFFIAGLSLLFSDAIHHFFVLPVWVGKTEFP
jgi:hypothetical protein